MSKEIELLAPAGSFESLIAAVQNGANAVYLGGKMFNARQNAANFDDEKLKEAIEYAHIRDVNVYLTLNTLLKDKELYELPDYLANIHSIGIDGVIVQDLGVAKFIKSVIPELELHASTQMTIHNLEGVRELEKLGFKRAVLARELTLKEIKHICDNTSLDIEVFVHGALCVCYSGQCLMSSLIGGRSGNRGLCAQPCRLPYSLEESKSNKKYNSGYLLSPKDLYSIYNVGDIIKSGAKSFKVEGRMKRPEYVATVIRIYRKYIDQYLEDKKINVESQDVNELTQIFNRGGFTKGYFYGKSGSTMMSYEKPSNWGAYLGKVEKYNPAKKEVSIKLENSLNVEDGIEFWIKDKFEGIKVSKILKNNTQVNHANINDIININVPKHISVGTKVYRTSSVELLTKAKESYNRENKKILINGEVIIKYDQPIIFRIVDKDNNTIEIYGEKKAEKAINKSLTKERLIEQLKKLGNTPFEFKNVTVQIDDDISIPVSEINNVRRKGIEKLMDIRKSRKRISISDIDIKNNAKHILEIQEVNKNNKIKLAVYLNRIDNSIKITQKADRYYIPVTEYIKSKERVINFIESYKNKETQIFIALPRILRQNLVNPIKNSVNELSDKIDGVLITGIGQNNLFDKNTILSGDFSLNAFNSLSIKLLKELGLNCITLSPELNISQQRNIINKSNLNTELIVYGRLPLMISEHCPVGSIIGSKKENIGCTINCSDNYYLVDRLKNKLPILTDKITCQSQILNSKNLFLGEELDKINDLKPEFIRLNFTIENGKQINDMIKFHREFLDYGKESFKKNKEFINVMKKDYTRGHYFRGVE